MNNSKFWLRGERASDTPVIEALLNHAFGPGRHVLTANRLRERSAHIADLAVVAEKIGKIDAGAPPQSLLGSVRFSPVRIGENTGALLLGPLVVHPEFQSQGCGIALVQRGLELAKAQGHRLVFLVGDLPYYSRAGFTPVPHGQVTLPGPVDPRRLLVAELVPGAAAGVAGMMGI